MGTRGLWSKDFLIALGNTNPDQKTINFVSAWTKAEDTEAKFNPLATTLDYGTNTKFNNCCGGNGVKNYVSRQQGIEASVITLKGNHRGYSTLRNALIANKPNDALLGGGLDTWGSGSSRVGVIFTRDTRDETLKSEENTVVQNVSDNGVGHNPEKIRDTDVMGVPSPVSHAVTDLPDVQSGITGDSVKNGLKIVGGGVVAIIGVFIVIRAVLASDTAKAVLDTAALTTPVGKVAQVAKIAKG